MRDLIIVSFFAAFFMAYSSWTTYLLLQVSDANKAQPRTLLCFDAQGRVTHGDNFKECHRVAYRNVSTF